MGPGSGGEFAGAIGDIVGDAVRGEKGPDGGFALSTEFQLRFPVRGFKFLHGLQFVWRDGFINQLAQIFGAAVIPVLPRTARLDINGLDLIFWWPGNLLTAGERIFSRLQRKLVDAKD